MVIVDLLELVNYFLSKAVNSIHKHIVEYITFLWTLTLVHITLLYQQNKTSQVYFIEEFLLSHGC